MLSGFLKGEALRWLTGVEHPKRKEAASHASETTSPPGKDPAKRNLSITKDTQIGRSVIKGSGETQ